MNVKQGVGIIVVFTVMLFVVMLMVSLNTLNDAIGRHSEMMGELRRQTLNCPTNTVENADIGNPAEFENIDPKAPLSAGVCNEANDFECGPGLSCVEGKCVVETAAVPQNMINLRHKIRMDIEAINKSFEARLNELEQRIVKLEADTSTDADVFCNDASDCQVDQVCGAETLTSATKSRN